RLRRQRPRDGVRRLPARARPLIWLLLKDLRILRRSPLLVSLLVVYPIAIAVLIGAALSAGPSKPRVAFANLVPAGESKVQIGGQSIDAASYPSRLFRDVRPVPG